MEYDEAASDFAHLSELDPFDAGWAAKAEEARVAVRNTHYQTLAVPANADLAAIKRAFREQCKRWHPDRQQNASADDQRRATTQFKRINEAYQVRVRPVLGGEARHGAQMGEGRQNMQNAHRPEEGKEQTCRTQPDY
jgi:DnaJ-domain-containing protein 1